MTNVTALAPPQIAPPQEAGSHEPAVSRALERKLHASAGLFTGGISPISLLLAWQDWAFHLAIAPAKQADIAAKVFARQAAQWALPRRTDFGQAPREEGGSLAATAKKDRRFVAASWQRPPFCIWYRSFLLAQEGWRDLTVGVPGVSEKHERLVAFYARQWLDMLAPSNFPFTNPEVLARTASRLGMNFVDGFDNLVSDLARVAGLPMANTRAFLPGRDVAVTPGDVVFRNEMIELIRYRPTTAQIRPEPILIVPAWIMKYYILDLSPKNSLIRHLVAAGFEVFCISWRNPGRAQSHWSFDDYRATGFMQALDVVSGAERRRVHAAGYCLGGTLLAIAAATMARDGDDRLASLTMLAALVDFAEPGEIGLFIDESQVTMIEDMMWSVGYLDQKQMAGAFQMLRSRDLLWSRIVHDYLMGERSQLTDLMAWNADATRMPARMHGEFLRGLYLNNDLARGRHKVGGRTVHLDNMRQPVFALGTTTDHVAPWRSVFRLTHLLDTDVEFVLTNGGHNAGVVSEPGHPDRAYRRYAHRTGAPHVDPDEWFAASDPIEGSWWPAWLSWLSEHSGSPVAAPHAFRLAALCEAPGRYVM